jgi:probable addiction module antidote protein
MTRSVPHHDFLLETLRDPEEAAAYLDAVAEDGSVGDILKAIRNITEAQGGFLKLARHTGLSRPTLYRTLSERGNPEISTLEKILDFYHLRIGFSQQKKAA